MKDASTVPQGFKKYQVSSEELKEALGIDWPGKILSVSRNYRGSGTAFEITMYVQPHELGQADRERYTRDVAVPVPVADPVPAPAEQHGHGLNEWLASRLKKGQAGT